MSLKLLDDHLIIYTLKFLNITDILRLEQTNKEFKKIIDQHQNIIWNNFYKFSKLPLIIINNNNFNYKFPNYTFSMDCPNINIRDKYKIAVNSHKLYLEKTK